MDPRRFDTLAKTFSTTGTRRGALAALLSGSLTLLGQSQPAVGRKRRGDRAVTIQGPCGDGSGPANECDRHRDCCTGICERSRPNKPKRCRCRATGQPCTQTRNCCQGAGQDLVCDEGTCQPAPCTADSCPSGQECLSNGTCATPCSGPADCGSCAGCRGAVGGGAYCQSGFEGTCGCTAGSCAQGSFCGPEGSESECNIGQPGCFTVCNP